MAFRSYARKRTYRSSYRRSRPYRRTMAPYRPMRTVANNSRIHTITFPGYIRFALNWDAATNAASNGTTWSAAIFPGFNGTAGVYQEYRIKSIKYRVRLELNQVNVSQVEEDVGGANDIFIDPVVAVGDFVNNLPISTPLTQNPNAILQCANAEMFRGTRYSKWRTFTPQLHYSVTPPVGGGAYANAVAPGTTWLPTDVPNVQHAPLTIVASENISPASSFDPQARYPQFVIEYYGTFEFRQAY